MVPYVADGNERDVNAAWVQILKLPSGVAVLNLDGGGDIPLSALYTLSAPRNGAWKKIKATVGVVMLIGDTQDETPPAGAPFIALDPVSGQPLFSSGGSDVFADPVVVAGSLTGVVGASFNSDDWNSGDTRWSQWYDVTKYVRLSFVCAFYSLAGVVGIANAVPTIEWSIDGTEPGNPASGVIASGAGANGANPPSPTATCWFVVAKYARMKLAKSAVAGAHRARVQILGQKV